MSTLYAAHTQGQTTTGVNIEGPSGTLDAAASQIFDILSVKEFAIKQATQVAITILSVDQIIMSKQAGGPKAPKQNNNWVFCLVIDWFRMKMISCTVLELIIYESCNKDCIILVSRNQPRD